MTESTSSPTRTRTSARTRRRAASSSARYRPEAPSRCASCRMGVELVQQDGDGALRGAVQGERCRSPTSSRSLRRPATRTCCATRTRSCRRSASSTSTSPARAGTRICTSGSARTCARSTACAGVAFAVWAPNARSVASSATSTAGTGACTRCARSAPPGSGSCSSRASRRVPGTSSRSATRGRRLRLKADPLALRAEVPPANASVVFEPQHDWRDAEWLERRSAADPLRGADVDLRGAPRLVAAEPRSRATGRSPIASWPTSSADYVTDLGFTHVELLPVMEHPFYAAPGATR